MTKWNMVDVSSNNHPDDKAIDWDRAKAAGVEYAMIKATEGTTYRNPFLSVDGLRATRAGIAVGYYHFARPHVGDAVRQADYFWSHVYGLPRALGLCLDLEVTDGLTDSQLTTWASTFLDTIPASVERRELYTSPSFLARLKGQPRRHLTWLASWGKAPVRPEWAWQIGTATVPGFPGPVDVDVYHYEPC